MDTLLNKIDININRASITSVGFHFNNDEILPNVSISLDLISVGGKKITSVALDTRAYYGLKVDADFIPNSVHQQIAEIVKTLSPLCIRQINSIEKAIDVSI